MGVSAQQCLTIAALAWLATGVTAQEPGQPTSKEKTSIETKAQLTAELVDHTERVVRAEIATTAPKLSFHGLKPGEHRVVVTLAGNDHHPLGPEQTLSVRVTQAGH